MREGKSSHGWNQSMTAPRLRPRKISRIRTLTFRQLVGDRHSLIRDGSLYCGRASGRGQAKSFAGVWRDSLTKQSLLSGNPHSSSIRVSIMMVIVYNVNSVGTLYSPTRVTSPIYYLLVLNYVTCWCYLYLLLITLWMRICVVIIVIYDIC